jgi:hypothetical protein
LRICPAIPGTIWLDGRQEGHRWKGRMAFVAFGAGCLWRNPGPPIARQAYVAGPAGPQGNARTGHEKSRRALLPGGFCRSARLNYFSFISLYSTCLRALGSNFMISIFSGMVFLFFVVV